MRTHLFIIRINRFSKFFSRSKSENKEITNTPKVVENIQNPRVLQQFAPASVLVNDKGDIIYITGRTGKYLEPVPVKQIEYPCNGTRRLAQRTT
jgi:two-component system CheB/CheR fusion protein